MSKTKQLKYRLTLLYVWSICYVIILISYCLIITPDSVSTDRALGLFAKTSAVILPQLTVIIAFFYKKTNEDIQTIIINTPFANFAYWTSIVFITVYTVLIVLGIPFHSLFEWKIEECTDNLAKIMGNVLFFSTGAVTYLFSKREQ